MTTLIFGLGLGVFIIFILWLSAGLICMISSRSDKKIGLAALAVVGIITIALITIPRVSKNPEINTEKVLSERYDQLFIWRTLLTVSLAISSLVALLAYVKFELMRPVKAVRIRNWIL